MRSSFRLRLLALALLTGLTPLFLFAGMAGAAPAKGQFMISAANPLAAKAGRDILEKGGSAIDAAIATQMVLTLVEPQSSGIGGGAFLLYFDQAKKKLQTYDGREKAPAAVTEDHFLHHDGSPKKFYEAVVGGGAVGVPGVVAMMYLAHQDHGILPWKDLFTPAIKLAWDGFPISERLFFLLDRDKYLKTKKAAAAYFYEADGRAKPVGTILKNPELAETLTRIANEGPAAFYEGNIARDIVATVTADETNPGLMGLADLKNYSALRRDPVCAGYRGNEVCGMGPPTSGGITLLQILKILETKDLGALAPFAPETIHLVAEASALAFADRSKYLGDADFVEIPVKAMLDAGYLKTRANLIPADKTAIPYEPGTPAEKQGALGLDDAVELPCTSHFSIIDKNGDAVSMTTSVENVFGSRLMTHGFILNNQLTDFSFTPRTEEGPVANRIEPNKRPRSSMSPTMAFDGEGNLKLVLGSPGGSRIIGYVLEPLLGVLDWGMSMQTAINMPHYVDRNSTLDLEKGTVLESRKDALEAMGYKVSVRTLNSGLHGILMTKDGYDGGADPRREGIVLNK
ncbi:MAG: gamma-glutamyltransferase [Alphaproteobacteria bacterium]|nr:MAG: gamma-glutamyltransferase [Alphaproteobacteria bacterium]